MEEIWKDVPNYEGLYQVSNLGNVKSLNYSNTKKEKLLKPTISGNGYYYVELKSKPFKVSILVAMCFLSHKPNGKMDLVVDHINNDRLDNRLENLQIITQRENSYRKQDKGTSKYKGVCWDKRSSKWLAQIQINGKGFYLGLFKCELAASLAYQNKLKTL